MEIIRLENEEQIRALLTKDELFEFFKEDGMPSLPHWNIPVNKSIYWLIGIEKREIVGLMILNRVNIVLMDGHIALFKKFRKKGYGEQFVNAVSDWIKKHTRAKSLIGYIPSHRQDVKQLAEKTFTHIGTITEAQSWDDKLIDVEIYQRIL